MRYRFITNLQSTSLLRLTLFSAPLLDETISGFLSIGLPLANKQLGLDYTQIGLLFGIGALASLVLDPFINLLSDRYAKRYWILGGLVLLGAGFALASIHNFVLLLSAFALIYVSISAAVGLAEAALIDQNPQDSARTMTRWTIMASIGDLLGPILVSLIIIQEAGWSQLCWIACIACLTMACILGVQRFPKSVQSDDEEDTPPVRLLDGFRAALRDTELVRWTILSLIPSMVDEIFIVYATFYLRDVLALNTSTIGILIAIHMIGGFLGLFVLDRFLLQRLSPERLLTCLALLAIASMVGFLTWRSIIGAGVTLFCLGLAIAGLYPIATAEAYKRFPGRSGTVRAVASLGAPFEVVLPYITGFVAGRFGVVASLCLLGTAPLLILLLRPYKNITR